MNLDLLRFVMRLRAKEAFTNNFTLWKRFRKWRSFTQTAKLKTNAA
jgi:hypothetical protein